MANLIECDLGVVCQTCLVGIVWWALHSTAIVADLRVNVVSAAVMVCVAVLVVVSLVVPVVSLQL